MKAVLVRELGKPLAIEERTGPEPGPGHVFVAVETSVRRGNSVREPGQHRVRLRRRLRREDAGPGRLRTAGARRGQRPGARGTTAWTCTATGAVQRPRRPGTDRRRAQPGAAAEAAVHRRRRRRPPARLGGTRRAVPLPMALVLTAVVTATGDAPPGPSPGFGRRAKPAPRRTRATGACRSPVASKHSGRVRPRHHADFSLHPASPACERHRPASRITGPLQRRHQLVALWAPERFAAEIP